MDGGVAVQLLTGQQLIFLAVQVTYALQYLHQQSIHHKDVAARNCTWDSNDANSRCGWQQRQRHETIGYFGWGWELSDPIFLPPCGPHALPNFI